MNWKKLKLDGDSRHVLLMGLFAIIVACLAAWACR